MSRAYVSSRMLGHLHILVPASSLDHPSYSLPGPKHPMSSSSGWVKVAAGFRLVASAAANQISTQGGNAVVRASKHGTELVSNVRIASVAISEENFSSRIVPPSPSMNSNTETINHSSIEHDTSPNMPAANDMNYVENRENPSKSTVNTPSPQEDLTFNMHDKSEITNRLNTAPLKRLEEGSPIPATRISRAFNFASLGLKLTLGTALEATSNLFNDTKKSSSSIIANDKNADILASSLCRMRGAALKIGQMLSIQDESVLPPTLTRALEQVRAGADAMPQYQLRQQLDSQFGQDGLVDWESEYFEEFDWFPIAAASIGQVHRAVLKGTAQEVAVKVQYPGVANSIESDLNNMSMLISMFGLMPKGLFMENIIRVGREELTVECDYTLERKNQERFRTLLESDDELRKAKFLVPKVIPHLCTSRVLTTEFAPGGNIDKVAHLSQDERNRIGRAIMRLTMLELFSWRFMQTDPNWGNFLHDVGTGTTYCIDFGAAREYSEDFVQAYCNMIWAAANKDEKKLLEYSKTMGFLTGEENEIMLNAHRDSGFTIGEPFQSNGEYDFGSSEITKRIAEKSTPFLYHRLA